MTPTLSKRNRGLEFHSQNLQFCRSKGGRSLESLSPGVNYLYVLSTSSFDADKGVKVGISRNPAQRIKEHVNAGRYFGIEIPRVWVSNGPTAMAREFEHTVKGLDGNPADEFTDVTFRQAVTIAQALVSTIPDMPKWPERHFNDPMHRELYGTTYWQRGIK